MSFFADLHDFQPREERRHSVKIDLFPTIKRMIVAASALQLHAQKRLCHDLVKIFGLVPVLDKVERRAMLD
jgi:hypothetical protein